MSNRDIKSFDPTKAAESRWSSNAIKHYGLQPTEDDHKFLVAYLDHWKANPNNAWRNVKIFIRRVKKILAKAAK